MRSSSDDVLMLLMMQATGFLLSDILSREMSFLEGAQSNKYSFPLRPSVFILLTISFLFLLLQSIAAVYLL